MSAAPPRQSTPAKTIGQAILNFIGDIPASKERKRRAPATAVRLKANNAAAKAALVAGALALPRGVAGWLLILPEMVLVWKIQRQLVADIAAIYGKQAALTPELMVYCLFQHTAAQGVQDLVVRVGQRALVRHAPWRNFGPLARRIGASLARRTRAPGRSPWAALAGAAGIGAYAYLDTVQVAATAIDLFERELALEPARHAALR